MKPIPYLASGTLAGALHALTLPDPEARSLARAALDELRPDVARLAEILRGRADGRVRTGAAMRLGVEGADDRDLAVDVLRGAVNDPNRYVVRAALRSLKSLGAREALPDYIDALADPDGGVAIAAVEALAALGDPTHSAHLLPLLRRQDRRLERAVLLAVERLGWRDAWPELLSFLQAQRGGRRVDGLDFAVPAVCIRILAGWRVREASHVLVQFVTGELGLRSYALDGLKAMRCHDAATALVPTLARAYSDAHEHRLAMGLLDLMEAAECREALPEIRRYLAHHNRLARARALEIVSAWGDREAAGAVRTLARDDPNPFLRALAAGALARILGPDAAADLVSLADDLNPDLRRAVREALEALCPLPPEGAEALSRLSEAVAAPPPERVPC